MNRQVLIWGLEELADRELQAKLWTGKVEGEMSSFDEAVSGTFDDSQLSRLLDGKREKGDLSDEAFSAAVRLRDAVRRVPRDGPPSEIIDHPTMDEVRNLASTVLALLGDV